MSTIAVTITEITLGRHLDTLLRAKTKSICSTNLSHLVPVLNATPSSRANTKVSHPVCTLTNSKTQCYSKWPLRESPSKMTRVLTWNTSYKLDLISNCLRHRSRTLEDRMNKLRIVRLLSRFQVHRANGSNELPKRSRSMMTCLMCRSRLTKSWVIWRLLSLKRDSCLRRRMQELGVSGAAGKCSKEALHLSNCCRKGRITVQ